MNEQRDRHREPSRLYKAFNLKLHMGKNKAEAEQLEELRAELEKERAVLETNREQLKEDRQALEKEREKIEALRNKLTKDSAALEAQKKEFETAKETFENQKQHDGFNGQLSKAERIGIWVGLSMLASAVPFSLGLLYDGWSGYNILENWGEYIDDLLLVIVAISANACSCAFGARKNTVRPFLILISSLSFVIFLSFYSFLYRRVGNTTMSKLCFITGASFISFLVNSATGFVVEMKARKE